MNSAMDPSPARIMVVEDDSGMASMLAEFLQLQGHQTRVFARASEALPELYRDAGAETNKTGVDLIICDINMPEMNGLEFVRNLRKVLPHLPVVLISAFGNERTSLTAHEAGATDYLNKPFKLSDLHAAVTTALGRTG